MSDATQDMLREAVPAFQNLDVSQVRESARPKETFDIGNMVRDLENKVLNPVQEQEEEEEVVQTQEVPETEEVEEQIETEPEKPKETLDTPLGKVDITKGPEKPVGAAVEQQEEIEVEPELPTSQKKAKAEFVRLHKENRAQKKQLADLETLRKEVETLRTQAPKIELEKIPEYVDLKKQFDEKEQLLQQREQDLQRAHKVVALADFKKTPEYENAVTQPWKTKVIPALDRLAKDKQIDGNVLLSVVQNRDQASRKAAFNQIVTSAELDNFDQQALIKAMNDYDDIAERHSFLEQNAIKAQEMTEAERKRHFEQGHKEYRQKYEQGLKEYRPKLLQKWFPNLENDPDTKAALEQINERVDKADWHSLPPESHAPILQAAAAAPLLEMMYSAKYLKDIGERDEKIKTLENEKSELEKTVKKLTKSTPSAGSGGSSSNRVDQPQEYEARNAPSIKESIGALVAR